MKITWKVLLALALIVVASYWAVDSVRPRSYSGSNLNFAVGSGPVMVTNPADEPVSAQLVGSGTRSFTVTSTIEGVPDASTREGSGRSATQLIEFTLPPGASEFTVARGTNVNFVAGADTRLTATVQPQGATEARTTVIVAGVAILGALFYISRTNGHRWIPTLGRPKAPVPAVTPLVEAVPVVHGQGQALRAYGDNRTET
jgi:hypothetical protein